MAKVNSPPLTPAGFQVLLAIARGHAHGYGIMGFVDEVTGGSVQLGPGTLYRTLARLSADGLVEEAPHRTEDEPHDARRRYYRLTDLGLRVARREAALLQRLAAESAEAGLLGERARTA
ncbi:PadR family transcriptional regulator [Prauserella shujinwangii]|uniref:PadR family transcriptional regulator n=1 Tax=Prauserella shujinwangii TaxID=1453103 RepID=A0A2T0LYG9_9PSEU|nr:PadR family transcriptional regulator [Prauserella shujinwangii]PRX49102.1 PadR family transcriptional regulator [Prauserella shujinwangii]